MASPFSKYQGEQVQPLNILPYTAKIADTLGQGIASIGEGIGAYQNFQRKSAEDKAKAKYLANGVLQQYMEPDGPEDDATGEVPLKVSDTAPAHIKELFKKTQGQPDGVDGIATTDLTSFLTLHSKYEQDEGIKFDRKLKQAGVDLQAAQVALQEKEFGLRATAQEQNYKFQLRDFEWRVARGEKSDALDAEKLQLEKDRVALEKMLGPVRLKALEAEVRINTAKATSTERALSVEQAREDLIQLRQGISPTEVVPTFGEVKKRSGFIQTPDGIYRYEDDIDAFLKKSGLKVEDVEASQPQAEIPYSTSISRAISGDATFDPTLPAVKNTSKNKKQFVQGVYEQLIKNFPEQRATIDHQFKWNAQAKGENKDVELDTARYDLAVKYANTQQFQELVGKSLGVKKELAPAVPSKPPTGVKIITQRETGYGVMKEIVAYKTDQRMVDDTYDAAFKQFKDRGVPFPMTRDDAYKVFGLFGGMRRWQTDSGKVMYTNEKGETKSQDEIEGMGLTRTPTTEAGMKRQAANNWVRQYVGQGVDIGNYTLRAKTKNKEDPMSEMPIIDPEAAQKDLVQIQTDVTKADKYIDKMIQMWKDKSWYENLPVFGAYWETEYTTYQRGLETFRKSFIAPGTETEKDAERLGDMMAQPTFWRNISNFSDPRLALETLELTRSLIADSATAKASTYGFEIVGKKEISGLSKEQAAKRISEIVEKMKDSYPDIYNKYSDKK